MRHGTSFRGHDTQWRRSRVLAALGAFMLLGAQAWAAGIITGTVKDSDGGVLPGVTVALSAETLGEPLVTYADGSGTFRFDGLNPGVYTLRAELDGFQPSETTLTLVVDQRLTLEFRLALATLQETVEVTAEAPRSSEVALLDQRRQAAVVSDSISAEEIRKNPDSDAAGVVERVTGVSILGGKYVFVRGLGERYSNTTLNGAAIPTTEPEKRVVPLDLFPAGLLESINVLKSYTPDRPGDFAAGLVELSTLDFPASQELKISVGGGHNSGATGEAFRRYAGGLGFSGSGGQAIPSSIPSARLIRGSAFSPGFTPEELQQFGRAFVGQWQGGAPRSAPRDQNFSITYGNTLGRLGIVISGTHARGYDITNEERNFYAPGSSGRPALMNSYAMTFNEESVRNGLIGNFGLRLSDGHRISLRSMMTRDSLGEDRYYEGYNDDAGNNWRNYRVRYKQEEVASNQLSGEHFFSGLGLGSSLEWSVGYSQAERGEDLRESLYEERNPGSFTLRNVSQSGSVLYFDLDDTILDPRVSWTTFYSRDASHYGSFKAGVSYTERERDFLARRFRFIPRSGGLDLTLLPDQLFVAENIRPNGLELREETLNSDAYAAAHTIAAAFAMADATFGKWRFVGGVRFEDSDQEVTTFDPFTSAVAPIYTVNRERDVLPALNLVYLLSGSSNIRFALSRTLNRPEFRELAPFEFADVVGGRSVVGNPELKRALIDGFDARWEWFPSAGEVVAASAFIKRIDSPIERIVIPTAQQSLSFANTESARLVGGELEYRRSLAVLSDRLRWWALNANYSYVDSSVTIGDIRISRLTNTKRSLMGQSDHVVNLAVQFFQPAWGTLVRALYNFSSERITEVGALGLPDTYEQPFHSVDLVFSQDLNGLARGLSLKLKASNLLDEEREFLVGDDDVYHRFRPGRSLGIGLSYSAF